MARPRWLLHLVRRRGFPLDPEARTPAMSADAPPPDARRDFRLPAEPAEQVSALPTEVSALSSLASKLGGGLASKLVGPLHTSSTDGRKSSAKSKPPSSQLANGAASHVGGGVGGRDPARADAPEEKEAAVEAVRALRSSGVLALARCLACGSRGAAGPPHSAADMPRGCLTPCAADG